MSSNRFRNRYKQVQQTRRRARARLVAGSVIGLITLFALTMLVLFAISTVRGCGRGRNSVSATGGAATDGTPGPRVRAAFRYSPAPWYISLDNDGVILAQSGRQSGDMGEGLFTVSSLQSVPMDGGKPRWETEVAASFTGFAVAGGSFICEGQGSSGHFSHLLRAYSTATGKQRWEVEVKDAEDFGVSCSKNVVCTGSRLVEDGEAEAAVRLEGYDSQSGQRLWRLAPPMKSLQFDHDDENSTLPMTIGTWDGVLSYQFSNVIGFVNAASGKLLKEFNFRGPVYDVQVNAAGKVAYAIVASEQEGACLLYKLPLAEGKSSQLARFDCTGQQFLLLLDRDLALLASYSDMEDGRGTNLWCYQLGKAGTIFEYRFEDKVISDMAPLPDSAGQYLLALSARLSDSHEPAGDSWIMRLRLTDRAVWETESFGKPVLWLTPFKHDCLALLQGGGVYSYDAASNKTRRIRKLLYDYLEPQYSPDRTKLAVSSYPEGYRQNRPGQPMQVVVFE
jgi:hypothetical protein